MLLATALSPEAELLAFLGCIVLFDAAFRHRMQLGAVGTDFGLKARTRDCSFIPGTGTGTGDKAELHASLVIPLTTTGEKVVRADLTVFDAVGRHRLAVALILNLTWSEHNLTSQFFVKHFV